MEKNYSILLLKRYHIFCQLFRFRLQILKNVGLCLSNQSVITLSRCGAWSLATLCASVSPHGCCVRVARLALSGQISENLLAQKFVLPFGSFLALLQDRLAPCKN